MHSGPSGLVEAARSALERVHVSPNEARDQATEVLDAALEVGDLTAASIAERALGLAAVHVGDLTESVRHLRSAVDHGSRTAAHTVVAEARMTLAGVLNRRGECAAAVVEIDLAVAQSRALPRSRALTQRATILHELGRHDEALTDYNAAWPALRRADDRVWMQRLLMNRGVLHVDRHEYAAAAKDLHRAEVICDELGLALSSAFVAENLVTVHRRLGDVPTALDYLAQAERLYRELDTPVGSLLIERGELLLSARLMSEAREAAEHAVAEYERTHQQLGRPEARLLLARAILFTDPETAGREARRAVRELTAQGRPAWATLARYTALVSRLLSPNARRVGTPELSKMADELAAAGWGTTVDDARLFAGRRGLGTRYAALAREQLQVVGRQRSHGPAERRVRGWLATSLLALDDGDPRQAARAAANGLRIIEDHRATMTATDLRARISGLGTDLARIGLRTAIESGTAWTVLLWAERGRARHLVERPATPPDDQALADLLARLRTVVYERTQQQRLQGPTAALERRQVELENAVRDLSRRQRSDERAIRTGLTLRRAELDAALGPAALVEFIELDGRLRAVCLVDGRATSYDLGSSEQVAEWVEWLPFGLRRLSRIQIDDRSRASASAMIDATAASLDAVLLAPLAGRLGDRPLVVVPTGALQAMPWGLLPSNAGRPVTVAPTAGLWLAAATRRRHRGPVVSAAGPGLPGAEQEVRAVARLWNVPPLVGSLATVAAVSAELAGAGIAHLAAHGAVRADNPQFSALSFGDGPLTVYDIERLSRGPDTVVLAACEAGRSVVLAGDELLGLAASFLAQDTRHLIASIAPLPDVETTEMMVALHRRLAAGEPVATALARTQREVDRSDVKLWAAASSFVCLGAGFSPAMVSLPPEVAVVSAPARPGAYVPRPRPSASAGRR